MDGSTPAHPVVQPSYQKFSLIMLGLLSFGYALSLARPIVVPLLFSLLLAMLLNPLVDRFVRWRSPRVLAIVIALMLAMTALAGLAYFIGTQAGNFSEKLPDLNVRITALGVDMQRWTQDTFDMERGDVTDAVEKVKDEGMSQGRSMVGSTLTTVGTLFAFFFLLPVFTFLLLLYKRLLITFVRKLFPERDQAVVQDVLTRTKGVVQSYLVGLVMEAGIVTVLNWTGLMIIGVEYALLLAVMGAVLNLIPYVGMIMATALTMLFALATMGPAAALWVLGLYLLVQLVDNNFIVPRVVASRVELNALASIIAVMIGGALWGIPGMFLAIPLTAMLKVIFDRVPALEPFGYVLGDGGIGSHRDIFRLPLLAAVHTPEVRE
ncbi:MAG: AI-2E family transporter [Flavobacteriales bacterium]|nr:AI-2E family transporter [Flavobacteriales bacterium]